MFFVYMTSYQCKNAYNFHKKFYYYTNIFFFFLKIWIYKESKFNFTQCKMTLEVDHRVGKSLLHKNKVTGGDRMCPKKCKCSFGNLVVC